MIDTMIVNRTLLSLGLVDETETTITEAISISVCKNFTNKLRDSAFESEQAVIDACAGETYYRFCLADSYKENEFSSFRAGDITIKQTPQARTELAAKFRDETLISAIPYLKDFDFIFRTVSA